MPQDELRVQDWLSDLKPEYCIYFGCAAFAVVAFVSGSLQLITALVIGVGMVSSIAFLLLTAKETNRGAKVWNFVMKNRIATDVMCTAAACIIFGTTPIGLAASCCAGLYTSAGLTMLKNTYGEVEETTSPEVILETKEETLCYA